MYELTGKIRRIGKQQTFASGFTKREVIAEAPSAEELEGTVEGTVDGDMPF